MHAFLDDAAWASPWRSRSVAERVSLTLGLTLWGLLAPNWWVAGVILLIVLVLAIGVARVPPAIYLRALVAPWSFILIGMVGVVVSLRDDTAAALVALGPFQITSESVSLGVQIAARAIVVTAAVILLAATTPMSELLAAMRRVGVPGVLVDIAASMYRMIFVLMHRARAVRQAQTARLGYSSGRRALNSTGTLFATVFISAWERARRLEAGLAGRGGTEELVVASPAIAVSAPFAAMVAGTNLGVAALVIWAWLR